MTDRRDAREVIATAISASGTNASDVEKAAGLRQGELQSYLKGSDIEARSLVVASGLLGISAVPRPEVPNV